MSATTTTTDTPDDVPALFEAMAAGIDSVTTGPPEYRMRQAVNRLDDIARTRAAIEAHRAQTEERLRILSREACQSETPEEFNAQTRAHRALVADLARLDRGLDHVDGIRTKALRLIALTADLAAGEAGA